MRNSIKKSAFAVCLIMLVSMQLTFAADKSKDLVGTWKYEAPSAPYEYSAGKLIFTEADNKIEGKVQIGSYAIDMRNLEVKNNEVNFGIYVENEYVKLKMTVKKNSFEGTASYSEGSLEVSGEKEK